MTTTKGGGFKDYNKMPLSGATIKCGTDLQWITNDSGII